MVLRETNQYKEANTHTVKISVFIYAVFFVKEGNSYKSSAIVMRNKSGYGITKVKAGSRAVYVQHSTRKMTRLNGYSRLSCNNLATALYRSTINATATPLRYLFYYYRKEVY